MLKSLLSNKEKLIELANTSLNENCSAIILKKLPKKLGDPGKFLILRGFSELKCKDLADLGASINLMPLSVWKKLGLPELIPTQMTIKLANQEICTPKGIARDVFVPVGKFTFLADFVIVDYESDPCVSLILGDIIENLLNLDKNKDLPPYHDNQLSGNPTPIREPRGTMSSSSSPILISLEEKYSANHDPIKEMDSILEDSIDENSLDENLDETISEMSTDEHALDYSSPPLWDDDDNNLFDLVMLCLDPTRGQDYNPPLYELPFHKEVPGLGALLSFSSENEEEVFNPGILTSKRFQTSLLPELSHRIPKTFKVTKILESPMEIFPYSYREDIRVLDVLYVVPTGRVKVPAGRYVVPTGRVKVPAGRYVVPTGKDNVIVSAGRSKVIPAGRTILVLLMAHKLLFKDVVGKLVKKVKALELKLKTRSRKVVMSESDKEEEEEQDVDPLIKLAKAAAASDAHVDVSPGADIPPSPPLPTGMSAGVSSGVSTGTPAGTSNKGKSPIMEVDPPVKRRTFRQMEEDRLGEEAAKRLFEEEHADLERQRAEMQRKRQQDVLDSAKYYTDADWTDIMGQVHANQGLTSDLLGPDVNEDNFAERMVALIAERRRAFAAQRFQEKRNKPMTYAQQKAYMRTFVKNQSTSIYTTGWTMKHVKSLSDEQLKSEFEKIRTAVADLQSQNIRRTLKRAGEDLEHDVSKKPKPTEVPMSSQPDVPQQQATNVPPVDPQQPSESSSQPNVSMSSGPEKKGHTYGTRRKSLGTRKKSSTALDLDADDRSFIRVLSDDDSDDDDDPVIFWSAFATWEVVPTPLGDINALYMMDRSSKYFTHLREILHLVDRQDLLKLYGMVVKYYEDHPLAGAGMMLWGDLQVLFESHEGGHGSLVWSDQQQWHIRSWRLFPFSNVHVLETISGKVVYMFADGSYPLSVQLMKKMLKHKLEIEIDGVGNDMTYAEQLIQFIKNQIAASIPSA
ncbi:anticodon-binding aminoacyl-tRNA synthetase, class 1a [Tanacetum coccineum]